MAAAQPIALPVNSNDNDFLMASGSLPGQNGSFTPASYTRRIFGSPASFRAGSFGSRFYPGMSPGQLLGPLDPNDFRFGKVSSSIESDRGSIINALNVFDRQDELCRDYQCCGVNLTDMHALVDHFEECHVVVVDPNASQPAYRTVQAAVAGPPNPYFPEGQVPQAYNQGSFDPDDMELDADNHAGVSSGSSSPPDTPISTPLSSYPVTTPLVPNGASGSRPPPISAFDTTTVLPSRSGHTISVGFPLIRSGPMAPPRAEDAFNAYAGYSDYSSLLPGTVSNVQAPSGPVEDQGPFNTSPYSRNGCVPPALLLNSNAGTPASTPGPSRVASPTEGAGGMPPNVGSSTTPPPSASNLSGAQTARASTTLSRPATSLLLSKPFKCPKPNCNKSYKQANGLKYHMTHGSCNFAPPKDLEHLQALLASKRSQKAEGDEPISDAELREVEKEAERRLRPYACGVGDCQRRYKNMNGLRYHYQHSGDHGAIGLALLASGQHECLQHTRSHSRHVTPATSNAPSRNSSPQSTPAMSQAQAAQPPSNYSPVMAAPPSYQSQSMIPPSYSSQPQHQMNIQPQHPQQMSYSLQPMSQ
ncbi:C2H2-type domain-containing protein [Abortiporus biennis]